MRLIGPLRLLEEGQCFLQGRFATGASPNVFREYGKALIGFLSPSSYNCLGICSHLLVFLCLYFVMYCYKSREQVACRYLGIVVQFLVLLLCGKQYDESCSAIRHSVKCAISCSSWEGSGCHSPTTRWINIPTICGSTSRSGRTLSMTVAFFSFISGVSPLVLVTRTLTFPNKPCQQIPSSLFTFRWLQRRNMCNGHI